MRSGGPTARQIATDCTARVRLGEDPHPHLACRAGLKHNFYAKVVEFAAARSLRHRGGWQLRNQPDSLPYQNARPKPETPIGEMVKPSIE